MGGERELLFGILAVQLRFVSAQQLVSAGGAWAADRSVGLSERLEIPDAQREMLTAMVEQAIEINDGDPKRTLERLGGDAAVLQSFGGSFAGDGFEPAPEATVGERYTLGPELGRGGIGRVVLATDTELDRPVALKELLVDPEGGSARSSAARLLGEARITGRLEHPNIVPVHELGTRDDGTLYYTMKVVRGRTLARAIDEAPDLEARLGLLDHFSDLCNAIAYAHSQGVVHRDIKPDNVMVGEFGETVALDWGLAKQKGDEEDLGATRIAQDVHATMEGQAIGTPAYMSPEQADGDVAAIDERSDVWGLGAVLHEILVGRPPFTGVTPLEVVGKVLAADRESITEGPKELIAIVEKALARRREDRYPSAKALAADVDAYRAGRRIEAYEYSSLELLSRFVQKNRAASIAAVVVMLAVLAAAVISFRAQGAEALARRAAEADNRRARRALAESLTARAQQLVDNLAYGEAALMAAKAIEASPHHPQGPHYDPSLDPDEANAARATLRSLHFEATQRRRLFLEEVYAGALPGATALAAAPDGSRFALGDAEGSLQVWDTETGTVVQRRRQYFVQPYLTFSPDGEEVAYASAKAQAWSVKTGEVRALSNTFLLPLTWAAPDLILAGTQRDWTVLDPVRGTQRILFPHVDTRAIALSADRRRWVVARADGRLQLFDFGGRLLRERTHRPLTQLQWSPSGDTVIAFGQFEAAEILDAATLERRAEFELPFIPNQAVADSEAPFIVISGPEQLALIDRERNELVEIAKTPGDDPLRIALARGGRLFVLHKSGQVSRWRVAPPKVRTLLHTSDVWRAALTEDGTALAGTRAGKVLAWRKGRAQLVHDHGKPITGLAASSRLDRGASVSAEGDLHIFRLSDGQPIAGIPTSSPANIWYGALALFPDGKLLFSGADRRLHVVDMHDGRIERSSNLSVGLRQALAVAPSGHRGASSTPDGWTTVFDITDDRFVTRLAASADRGRTTGLGFSPDSRRLAVSGVDGVLRIFDVEAERLLRSFPNHGTWINVVEYSPDGRHLLSGSDDRTAAVTDAETGVVQLRLPMPGQVSMVGYSGDGARMFISGGPRLELFEIPTDPFEVAPATLLAETSPVMDRRAAPMIQPPQSRILEVAPNLGRGQIAGRIAASPYSRPLPGAQLEVLDGRTAQVLSSTQSDAEGRYRIDVPDTPHGLRLTVGDKSRVVFGSVTEAGVGDGLIWEPLGYEVWAAAAPTKVDPSKNILYGLVRYGSRRRYNQMADVGCVRLSVEPDGEVFYLGRDQRFHNDRESTHPGGAGFRIYNVPPNQTVVITAEAGDAKVRYEVPPFPPHTAINVRVRFDAEDHPQNPTPADCEVPTVVRP